MINALVISYHFTPMDVIASRRAESYASFLKENGIFPTILTFRWEMDKVEVDLNGTPKKWDWKWHDSNEMVLYEEFATHNVIRIPRVKSSKKDYSLFKWNKIRILNKLLIGQLDFEDHYIYECYKKFLWQHLNYTKYDIVISLYSPHSQIRLAYNIYHKYKIDYIVDYRDLWDNRIMNRLYNAKIYDRLKNYIISFWHKKWISDSKFFISVSQPLVEKISSITKVYKGYPILNGFEKLIFDKLIKEKQEEFVIFHGGNIYPDQNLSYFIESLKLFISYLNTTQKSLVKLQMLMLKDKLLREKIISEAKGINFDFRERLPRPKALQKMKNSEIVFFPAFKESKGIYSGKIFEYLGCENNILVTPSDNDVVEELINKTKSGLATNKPAEAAKFLYEKFLEWQENGVSDYRGDKALIEQYSREFQVKLLSDKIYQKFSFN